MGKQQGHDVKHCVFNYYKQSDICYYTFCQNDVTKKKLKCRANQEKSVVLFKKKMSYCTVLTAPIRAVLNNFAHFKLANSRYKN
jgi:hypothetical protein